MMTGRAWLAFLFLMSVPLFAQTPAVPTMDHEPHHHLTVQNEYVKIFDVRVPPGDSIILHSHDQDTVAIAIGEQLVTVGIPGKPDVHQKNADAQVRLQRSGYMHSTHVDGDTPYHTIAVELMRPQTNFRNVCAEILAGQPLNCPGGAMVKSAESTSEPLVESDQTQVRLVRVLPHQSVKLTSGTAQVIVALDPAAMSFHSPDGRQALPPGGFVWIDGRTGQKRVYQNQGDEEVRFIEILFRAAT